MLETHVSRSSLVSILASIFFSLYNWGARAGMRGRGYSTRRKVATDHVPWAQGQTARLCLSSSLCQRGVLRVTSPRVVSKSRRVNLGSAWDPCLPFTVLP